MDCSIESQSNKGSQAVQNQYQEDLGKSTSEAKLNLKTGKQTMVIHGAGKTNPKGLD